MADDIFADLKPESADDIFAGLAKDERRAGVRAALKDIVASQAAFERHGKTKGSKGSSQADLAERYLNSTTLGGFRQLSAGLGAGITELQRRVPGGKEPAYSAKDYYDAYRAYQKARQDEFAAKHPVTSVAVDVAGGLAMPGAAALGKFVVGKTAPALAAAGRRVPAATRVGQGLRASGAAGATTGVQAAATAAPGEEVEDAKSGAVMGALAAPVVGGALAAGAKVAPALGRTAQRVAAPVVRTLPQGGLRTLGEKYLTPPGADVTSLEKLTKVLQKQELDPTAVQAALDEWSAKGGVTPNMLDILREAGASPATLRLLNESEVTAPVRAMAERQARETVEGVQGRALEATGRIQTGEPRTPSQIKADIDARRAQVDEQLAGEQARIDAELAAGRKDAPPAPVEQEAGAALFMKDLNRKFTASEQVYKEAYGAAEAAAPEEAIIAADQVRPLIAKLEAQLKGLNPRLKGVASVRKELDILKDRVAPGNASDWPEGEVMENAAPLTVQDAEFMRQMMGQILDETAGKTGSVAATKVKNTLDTELNRLFDEGLISGNPEVVDLWRTANAAYAEHMNDFGRGLAKTLTARRPDGSFEVEPFKAADVIFGPKSEGSKPLNSVLSDLREALRVASPEAAEALKGDLYGRLAGKPEELAKLLKSTGGRNLLPRDLAELNIGAATDNAAAEEAAAAAKLAAEEGALGAKAPIEGEAAALDLGRKALETESDAFVPAVGAIDQVNLPLAAAGSKGDLIARIESPGPEDAISKRFMGARASKNLGATLGDDQVATWQGELANIERNAQNAREMARAVGGADDAGSPLIEHTRPGDIVYPKVGAANVLIRLKRSLSHLSPDEQIAMLKRLSDPATGSIDNVKASLKRKYPRASVAATPAATKGLLNADGDEDSLERLRLEYGVD